MKPPSKRPSTQQRRQAQPQPYPAVQDMIGGPPAAWWWSVSQPHAMPWKPCKPSHLLPSCAACRECERDRDECGEISQHACMPHSHHTTSNFMSSVMPLLSIPCSSVYVQSQRKKSKTGAPSFIMSCWELGMQSIFGVFEKMHGFVKYFGFEKLRGFWCCKQCLFGASPLPPPYILPCPFFP
jgi:hypothetical protein